MALGAGAARLWDPGLARLFTEFCLSNNVCVRVYNQSRIREMIDQRGEPEFMDPPANAFYQVHPSYTTLSSGVSYAAK